jgi:hypothetical protein
MKCCHRVEGWIDYDLGLEVKPEDLLKPYSSVDIDHRVTIRMQTRSSASRFGRMY